MSDLVLCDQSKPHVAAVTLNRPQKRNALCNELMRQLCRQMSQLDADESIRVILLQGAGPVFCAGLDLAEASDLSIADESASLVNETLRSLHNANAVTIACVHGAAIAGGAGVMSACDLVVAEEGSKIGYPEVRRGLIAALVSDLLYSQVGPRRARELLLVADLIEADTAREYGLVNQVVAVGAARTAAAEMADRILLGGPSALRQTKQLINKRAESAIGDSLHQAMDQHLAARGSAESMEGMQAFLEKRKPSWCDDGSS